MDHVVMPAYIVVVEGDSRVIVPAFTVADAERKVFKQAGKEVIAVKKLEVGVLVPVPQPQEEVPLAQESDPQ